MEVITNEAFARVYISVFKNKMESYNKVIRFNFDVEILIRDG